jgi:hypothetical protein
VLSEDIEYPKSSSDGLFEISGKNDAVFINGGCDGKRTAKDIGIIQMPNELNDNDNEVFVVNGWARYLSNISIYLISLCLISLYIISLIYLILYLSKIYFFYPMFLSNSIN